MKWKLAENIRGLRKEKELTQEQLAEAMGVSVGAVSKWELGSSAPELEMLIGLAQYFETSVDMLLGYAWERGSMGEAEKALASLTRSRAYEEGMALAEKSLLKYPNSFSIVYRGARLYFSCGLEHRRKKALRRALTLYRQAEGLLYQNTDESISALSMGNDIARTLLLLDRTEEALEALKRNNLLGLNDGSIGMVLATTCGKPEEAAVYLSKAMWNHTLSLFTACVAMVNVFVTEKRYDEALALTGLMRTLLQGLRTGEPSYLLKGDVMLLTAQATVECLREDFPAAQEAFRAARREALAYDAAPVYGTEGVRYLLPLEKMSALDDFGETALRGIENTVAENEAEVPEMRRIWDEIQGGSL